MNYEEIGKLLHCEVKPALGCTEPVAAALAVARAREVWPASALSSINVEVSANILKNGMGVGVPGTGKVGLHIAAALAAVCGRSSYGLQVLRDLTPEAVAEASALVESGAVAVSLAKTDKKLYTMARCSFADGHTSAASVQDEHDNIVYVEQDGVATEDRLHCDAAAQDAQAETDLHSEAVYDLCLTSIYDYACNVPLSEIEWLEDAVRLNSALAKEGLAHDYGLKVGKTISAQSHDDIYGNGFIRHCMAATAAASDARMAGCTLAAMSNSGSGNQGITVTMPVVSAAEQFGSSREELLRALALAHLTAIHIKHYLGRLSALCGCVIASTGASCGIVMLRGGSLEQICYSIKNMIGNITGMVCDGAKEGCALKVASGVASAIQSAVMALDGLCISEQDGIIEADTEKTIRNLGQIGSRGMAITDEMILNIMVCK